jgi:exportin-T
MLQEMRELQELQRTLYTFLHGMVTHDLSMILLAPTCTQYLETIMQLLLYTSCSHKDILLRKVRIPVILMNIFLPIMFFSSLRGNYALNFQGSLIL